MSYPFCLAEVLRVGIWIRAGLCSIYVVNP